MAGHCTQHSNNRTLCCCPESQLRLRQRIYKGLLLCVHARVHVSVYVQSPIFYFYPSNLSYFQTFSFLPLKIGSPVCPFDHSVFLERPPQKGSNSIQVGVKCYSIFPFMLKTDWQQRMSSLPRTSLISFLFPDLQTGSPCYLSSYKMLSYAAGAN